jgi:peptidoglycan/xylan/chitin deacetylase (PgdA/CDA1 family)
VDRRTFLVAAAASIAALSCSDGTGGTGKASANPTTTTVATPGAPPPTAPARARFVDAGPRGTERIALTFHTNGDLTLAQQLLDTLADRKVAVTAFVVGTWLDANPSWARRLLDAGHELANHTYTHPTFGSLSPDAMRDEIVRCRDLLVRLTGTGGAFFRPSGTDDGTTPPADVVLDLAGEAGYGTVLGFDVDPLDYTDPGADAVVQATLATARGGSIVSLHFGHPGTIAAVPHLLDGLEKKGLAPVPASKLLT